MNYEERRAIECYMDEFRIAQDIYENEQGYQFCSLRCQFCPLYQMAGGICKSTWESADQDNDECIINLERNI